MKRRIAGLAALGLATVALTACNETSALARPTAPIILTGAKLPTLVGTAPNRLVAFRHLTESRGQTWAQIPVQVDQRKVVAFGSAPASNGVAGVTGTVYGSDSGGPTALQYADPNTFVGADADPNLDANDEVVFMASDAGGVAQAGAAEPSGVVAGSGVAVRVDDPRQHSQRGWVYLFRSAGALDSAAGKDYVDYRFSLTSGAYKSTYRRAVGPNPETSKATTVNYEIGFSDRWFEDSWKVRASGATGVDVLDGHKNQFALDECGRSNRTFADAEGAFVANIDGPVRAIRSYVGANSGPLTERTHLMYRDREVVVSDLRVHPIPGILDYIDYSAAAKGMTYRSSTLTGGATVDGQNDSVSTKVPAWEAVDGSQGRIFSRNQFSSSAPGVKAGTKHLYRDQTSPPETQCWGDSSLYGASGLDIATPIPLTDPRSSGSATLQGRRVTEFGSPSADPSKVSTDAADWAANFDQPLTTTVSSYQPEG